MLWLAGERRYWCDDRRPDPERSELLFSGASNASATEFSCYVVGQISEAMLVMPTGSRLVKGSP